MLRTPLARALLLLGLIAGSAISPARAEDRPATPPPAPPESFSDDQRSHWAYQAPKRPEIPQVKNRGWVRNPIDAFLLSALESVEYKPSPEADRVALIRRVTFDLTGLPPTPEEVRNFLLDNRPDAYEKLVDRLLASPHFGERAAQHWLDLAHYADSNGFELDAERPDAWRYRDWVVNALNANLPYDQFVRLQIAGDELRPDDHSALVATGFGRCGPREVVGGNVDPRVRRQSELTEVTGTVGSVFLGLTMACARCHDHKFDPIPTTDYYRLQSFFAASEFVDIDISTRAEQDAYKAKMAEIAAKVAPFRKRMGELEAPYRKKLKEEKEASRTAEERRILAIPEKDRTPTQKKMIAGLMSSLRITWEDVAEAVAKNPKDHAERESIKRQIFEIERNEPKPPPKAMALADTEPKAPDVYVYRRGDVKTPGPRVEPRPPGVLLANGSKESYQAKFATVSKKTGRRKALAEWLTRPDNPLTPRVIVNRLWLQHFGRGIVATPSDFGVRGEPPSNQDLLDWLATEFVARGWDLKAMHRLMVTSSAYRQTSSNTHPKQQADDPDNALVWRQTRRRLDAEGLRDTLLTVTGELNRRPGGPGVLVPIEKEIEDLIFTEAEVVDLWPETLDVKEHNRRSLYLFRKRNVRYPMFDAFDAPDTQTVCPERSASTHALQALVMLNSSFTTDRAKALAGRVLREGGPTVETKLDLMQRLAICRPASPKEVETAKAFLSGQSKLLADRAKSGGQTLASPSNPPAGLDRSEGAAWVDLALAMLNRNEFLYVP